jgi:hypothetical protein
MVVMEEESVTADEGPTVPTRADEARPDRRMREPRAAESSSIKA